MEPVRSNWIRRIDGDLFLGPMVLRGVLIAAYSHDFARDRFDRSKVVI